MRSKLDKDGRKRIVAKIPIPMGSEEITNFALANPVFEGHNDALNAFESYNKRQLFNLAKESVRLLGVNEIHEKIIETNWSKRQRDKALEHVKQLFPEID